MALEIHVITHGGLGAAGRNGSSGRTVVVAAGTAPADVLVLAGLDPGVVGVVVSRGKILRLDVPLEEDCAIDVFPIIGGG